MLALLTSALLFSIPFERVPSVELMGITLRISSILLIGAACAAIPYLIAKKRFTAPSPLDLSVAVFLAIAATSAIFAESPGRSVIVLCFLGVTVVGYALVSRVAGRELRLERVQRIIIASGIATSAFGLYQFVGDAVGLPIRLTLLTQQYSGSVFGFARVQSVGLEPLYFANFLLLPILLLMHRIAFKKERPGAYELGGLTVMAAAFCLALSRGAYAALLGATVCALAFYVVKRQPVRHVPWLIGCVALAVGTSLLAVRSDAGSAGVQTFSSQAVVQNDKTEAASVTPRLNNYQEAWRLFGTKPLLGVGIGNYGVVNTVDPYTPGRGYMIVNNQYLETLAETGLLGFFGLAAVVIAAFRQLLRAYSKDNALVCALGATLLGLLIQYNFMSTIYMITLWSVLGLIQAATSLKPGETAEQP